LLAAAALRFHDLDRTSLWYDEAVSWSQSNGSLGALLSAVAQDNYPPLHNIVLWLTMPVTGDSETALRIPSAMLGVLAVWFTYLIGRMIGGNPVGLLAAALLAISPFHIWYSTEARMYALLAATGLAFLLSLLRVLKNPSASWLGVLALSGTLFLYSHIYAVLGFLAVGLTCALFVVIDAVRTRRLGQSNAFRACLGMAMSGIAFLPWLVILTIRAKSVAETGFWIAFPDAAFLKGMAFNISSSLALLLALAGLAVFALARALLRKAEVAKENNWQRRSLLIILAYSAGPVILAYLYSVLVQPILFDRYLIAAWPGLLLLASEGANRLLPRLAPLALVAAALVLTYPELTFTLSHKVRPEWRDVVAEYESKRAPDDHLVLYKGFAAPALAYYLRGSEDFSAANKLEDLQNLARTLPAHRQWLLIVHSNTQETGRAQDAFGVDETSLVAQNFGWGASGLKLLNASALKEAEIVR
jgi:uncharacterized membrane protein